MALNDCQSILTNAKDRQSLLTTDKYPLRCRATVDRRHKLNSEQLRVGLNDLANILWSCAPVPRNITNRHRPRLSWSVNVALTEYVLHQTVARLGEAIFSASSHQCQKLN